MEVNGILIIIEEIEKALNAETFLSALALALTLPDICGKAAYPEIERSGERYRRWYDENITKYCEPDCPELPDSPDSMQYPKFDGAACWKLRCSLLHSGEMPDVKFDEFELSIHRPVMGIYDGGMRGYRWPNGDYAKRRSKVRVDIADLASRLFTTAKAFLRSHKGTLDFSFVNFEIIDMDEEADRLRRLECLGEGD